MKFHQTATDKNPLTIRLIEVAAFAAVAAIGKSLGDIFQERLRESMGGRRLDYRPSSDSDSDSDRYRDDRRRPARRNDDEDIIRRYKF